MIPQHIKDKIEAYSKEKYPSLSDAKDEDGNYEVSEFEFNMQEGNQQEIHSAVEYGYTLRDDEVQSLKDEVERLKGEIKSILKAVADGNDLYDKIKEWS